MKLSIITINYNNKDGLLKTVDSINSQVWRDFEWVIIDGGSTDGSKEIIEKLASNTSSNVSFWCSERDDGVYNAMNKGIRHCTGDFINFMNSGDVFYSKNTLYDVFYDKVYESDILYGDWVEVFEDHEEFNHFYNDAGLYSLCICNICHQSMFVKASILHKKGFDENFKILSDWSRWVEEAINNTRFEYLNRPICYYDMSGMSNNKKDNANIIGRDYAMIRQQWPSGIRSSFEELDYYTRSKYIVIFRSILDRKGFLAISLKMLLSILNFLFVKIDFNHYNRNHFFHLRSQKKGDVKS